MTPPGIKPACSAVPHPTALLTSIFKEIEEKNYSQILVWIIWQERFLSANGEYTILLSDLSEGQCLRSSTTQNSHSWLQQTAVSWHSLDVWNSYGLSRLKLSIVVGTSWTTECSCRECTANCIFVAARTAVFRPTSTTYCLSCDAVFGTWIRMMTHFHSVQALERTVLSPFRLLASISWCVNE